MNQYENEILKKLKFGKQTLEELKKSLQTNGSDEISLSDAINALENEGKIYQKDTKYEKIEEGQYIGTITISKDGTGYVNIIKGNKKLVFMIKKRNLNGALPKDTVIIEPEGKKYYGQQPALVQKIIKRNKNQIYKLAEDGFWDVYGINTKVRLKLPKSQFKCDIKGTLIMAEIETTPLIDYEGDLIFKGNYIKTIGHIDDPKGKVNAIGNKYGFNYEFTEKEQKEASSIPQNITEEDYADRVDLTNEKIFTIDSSDTKDMDDAISISKNGDKYILKVHISDVSHYIKRGTYLDKGAKKRGNSAYLADSVFPMFPRNISNGICSLNPNEKRLTKTVEMTIDENGNIIDSKIYKSIIKSNKKMSYEAVNQLFEGIVPEGYQNYINELNQMRKLSKIITQKRKSYGSLDFFNAELKIKTDKNGKTTEISVREQQEAEKLIENFMIYANTTVATHFGYLDIPFVFRIHEGPEIQKLQNALTLIKGQNIIQNNKAFNNLCLNCERVISGKKETIKPEEISAFLKSIKDESYYEPISKTLLKCMKRAEYSPENKGHFGLSEEIYCHFTSPIRRYADLMVHRMIDYMLQLYKSSDNKEEIMANIESIQKEIKFTCEHISSQEKNADEAEKMADELKAVEYFQTNIEDYEGPIKAKIVNINSRGITLIINGIFNVKIDIETLTKKGYTYKKESHTYTNKATKDTLRFGNQLYLFNPTVIEELRTIEYNDFNKNEEDFSFETNKNWTLRRKTPYKRNL